MRVNHFNRVATTLGALNGGKRLPDNSAARTLLSEAFYYSQHVPCIAPAYGDILTIDGNILTPVPEDKQTAQAALQTAQTRLQAILDKALAA